MKEKECFKCGMIKPLSDYYKHSQMKDGHLNKCKNCTKKDINKRYSEKIQDPDFKQKERERHREKYYRLGYKEKQLVWDKDKPWKKTSTYKNLHRDLKIPEHLEAHHWSYKEENLRDVILLSPSDHKKLHEKLLFCEKKLCFIKLYNKEADESDHVLLDTKQKHEEFIKELGIVINKLNTTDASSMRNFSIRRKTSE